MFLFTFSILLFTWHGGGDAFGLITAFDFLFLFAVGFNTPPQICALAVGRFIPAAMYGAICVICG
jgi:hypothetical protein